MKEPCSCKSNIANDEHQVVFVYGTLKREGSNHHWLAQAAFVGEGETCECYALYQGEDPWPHMVDTERCYPVHGEVYLVKPDDLALLDELEDCPQLYMRKKTTVRVKSGEHLQAWAYFSQQVEGNLLADGFWCVT